MEEERSFCMAAKQWKRSIGVWVIGAMVAMSMTTAYAATTAKTAKEQVNVRKTASTEGDVVTTLSKGENVTIESQKGDWCQITVGKKTGYIRSDMLDQKTTADEKTTANEKATGINNTKIYGAKDSVNVRSKPSTDGSVVQKLSYGESMEVLGRSGDWYEVNIPAQGTCYIRSDMVSTTAPEKAKEASAVTPISEASSVAIMEEVDTGVSQNTNVDANSAIIGATASSATGAVVEKPAALSTQQAQDQLKQLGFYHDSADGSSGKVTTAAIKAFQTSYDLAIDGELGAETSSKIQEVSTQGKSEFDAMKVRVSPNGVILSEWFNGMKYVIPKYEHLRVVDVATGEEFKLRAFSLGNHADVEPPTKEDTNTLYRINGYKWSWTPRPIWVYVKDQAYAAAINVQPHGPDTIPDNGMSGQICMHFLYSRQHNTGQENKNLQAAIWTAFEQSSNAPAPGTQAVAPVQTEIKPVTLSEEELFALIEEESN